MKVNVLWRNTLPICDSGFWFVFTAPTKNSINNNQHNVISTFAACNLLKSLKLSGTNKSLPEALAGT